MTRPETPDDLWLWVKAVLGVEIPRAQVCPDHAAPFDAFCAAYFARDSVVVWEGSRGFAGKSFMLALLSLTEMITLGANTVLLGGSGEQSQRVHAYLSGEDPNAQGMFWSAPMAPRWLLASDPSKREARLKNGGYIKALTASSKSVRGPHPQRLRLDEVDEMELDIFDAAMGQTMGRDGVPAQTVCSSTHQYPDGTMTEVKRRAEKRGWPVYEWCYRESLESSGGWLEDSEVARKRREVPEAMWEVEYELQEPSPESRAIDVEAVRELFDPSLGEWAGDPDEEVVIAPPGTAGVFAHGTDWAKAKDWTVLHTVQEMGENEPDVLVAWTRTGRKPWPLMIEAHNRRVREYGGRSAHDATGVGDVCADYLEVESEGFDFRGRKRRAEMLSSYIAAIENGQYRYPLIRWAHGEHKYASVDDIYGAGHLPDSIAAGALAHWARTNVRAVPDQRVVRWG